MTAHKMMEEKIKALLKDCMSACHEANQRHTFADAQAVVVTVVARGKDGRHEATTGAVAPLAVKDALDMAAHLRKAADALDAQRSAGDEAH